MVLSKQTENVSISGVHFHRTWIPVHWGGCALNYLLYFPLPPPVEVQTLEVLINHKDGCKPSVFPDLEKSERLFSELKYHLFLWPMGEAAVWKGFQHCRYCSPHSSPKKHYYGRKMVTSHNIIKSPCFYWSPILARHLSRGNTPCFLWMSQKP